MHPMALMFLGIFMPIPLAVCFLLPLYGGVFGAVLAIYHEQSDSVLAAFTNVLYIVAVYRQAFTYWLNNLETVNHFTYSAPLLLLPLLGLFIATWLTVKLGRASSDYFRANV